MLPTPERSAINSPGDSPLVISARAYSDDRVVEVEFDAAPWFDHASDREIRELADCDWGGDEPADAVALHFRHVEPVASLFRYLDQVKTIGFECHVDETNAVAWIAMNRPALAATIAIMSHSDAFACNIKTLAIFLRDCGIDACSVEYSGSGDSGDGEYQSYVRGEQAATTSGRTESLSFVEYYESFLDPTKDARISTVDVRPEDFLSRLLDQAIEEHNHGGWENSDGGGGCFTVYAKGSWTFEHYDNIVTTEYSNYDGEVDLGTEVTDSETTGATP